MVALTITVGFATWAWANGSATHNESNINGAVVNNLNQLNENYAIVYANFPSSPTQNITVWFYNYGTSTLYIKQVWVSNVTDLMPITTLPLVNTTTHIVPTTNGFCSSKCLVVPASSTVSANLKITSNFQSGILYQIKAVAYYGTSYTYQQMR